MLAAGAYIDSRVKMRKLDLLTGKRISDCQSEDGGTEVGVEKLHGCLADTFLLGEKERNNSRTKRLEMKCTERESRRW